MKRGVSLARGRMALARSDYAAAIKELNVASGLLSPRGGNLLFGSQHIPVWFSLGEAHLGAGKPGDAVQWFEKVATSGYEHVTFPIEFVRSFYYLGKIHEAAGDMTKAREAYRRFVGYWKDGDLDRDRVAESQRKLAGG